MKIRRVYEELLKQEKRAVLRLKCLSGATAFIFFAVFLMALLGIDVVQKLDKSFDFESGNCVVEESIFTGENVSCNCGMRTCFGRYPCLRVLVRMSAEPEQSEPVLLHNTFYDPQLPRRSTSNMEVPIHSLRTVLDKYPWEISWDFQVCFTCN